MLTRDERRALLFLAAVAAAGGVIRIARRPAPVPAAAAVAPELAGADLVRQASRSLRAEAEGRPLAPGERVNVDSASAAELERLPRVGKRLAARIVADRGARGPFGSLARLGRVPGVGERLLRDLEPFVSFSGGPSAAAPLLQLRGPEEARRAERAEGAEGPERPPERVTPAGAAADCAEPISPNQATPEQLACLPGIGPVLAERIVAERGAHGPYREMRDLTRVSGIGPRRIARLKGRLTFP